MSQGQGSSSERFHDEIDRLSRDVLENRLATPDAILLQAVNELSEISPIHAVGVLQMPNTVGSITYSHLQGRETGLIALDSVLKSHRESLAQALAQQTTLTLRSSSPNGNGPAFFTGLPAGNIGNRSVALGLLSPRELTERERAQLQLLGRLIGQSAENARVHQQMVDEERQRAVNLIGLIAHELRTPLTGLRGNIQLALMASRGGKFERVPTRLETAIQGVDTMTALVQSLLDVSRLERGTYHLELASADLRETVQTAIGNVSTELDPDLHRITLSQSGPGSLNHDRHAIERVVGYLLRAVLRYSAEGTTIDLAVTDTGDDQRLDIRYAGVPFTGSERLALLAPLYGGRERSDDSTGMTLPLNLAFCRGVVTGHGGHFELSDPGAAGDHVISMRIPSNEPEPQDSLA